MKSQLKHKNGIYTEFEWCYGNFKDWFLDGSEKLNEKNLTVMFPVKCYIMYQTQSSRASSRSNPILQIYKGNSYEELMGLRIKAVSPDPISITDIQIIRTDTPDLFDDSFNVGHVNSPSDLQVELVARFKKEWYDYGANEENFYLFYDQITILKNGDS